ncbi:MAG: hypothetical protein HQK89_05855 [Nitrospirae bacterium]|nr:hypothetical protein [Nitrospirota bacterium]
MPNTNLAKITAPRLHMVMERKRCFQIVDTALDKSVVWVSAPGGSGKTTLVASYLNSRKVHQLWYRIDERDIDVATFFQYIKQGVKMQTPTKPTALPDFTPDHFRDINSFTMMYFERIFEELKPPYVLVFDDYQDLPADSAFHEMLCKGLYLLPEGIPEGVKIILISRGEPPPAYVRLLANGKINFVGWDEVRFTLDETWEFIKSGTRYTVEDGVVEKLYDETGGWVAGLILAIGQIDKTKNTALYKSATTREILFDYFSREIFGTIDKEVRELLLKTAYLPEFNVEMAKRISVNAQTERVLTRENKQYFIMERHVNDDVIFSYHALFRDFLLKRSKDYYGQKADEIILQAADILEEYGYVEESARLLIEIKHWERLERLMLKNVPDLIAIGRNNIADSWFSLIPDEFVRQHPWLMYWHGMNRLSLNPQEARTILEAVYVLFTKIHDSEGRLLTLCAVIKTFMFEWKNFYPLDYWIKEFEDELIEAYRNTGSIQIREEVVSSIVAAFIFRKPGHRDMDYWLTEAEEIVRNSKDTEKRMFIGYNITLYYLWSGLIFKAGRIVEILSPLYGKTKKYPLLKLMCLRAEVLYRCYRASYKKAIKTVEEGFGVAEETGIHLMDMMLLGVGIYASVPAGDNERAQRYLQKMESCMEGLQCYGACYYQIASLVAIANGNISSAIEHAEKHLAIMEQQGNQLMMIVHKYNFAHLLIEAGRYDEARRYLRDIERIGEITKSMMPPYYSSMAEALIALKNNDIKQFADRFENSVKLAEVSGMRWITPFRKPVDLLCKAALDREVQVDYVKELIRLHNLTPHERIIENWPYPLKIYTFGRFSIEKDGKPVEFKGKVQKIPLLLLKVLVASGGTSVGIENISDTLWPEVDGDTAKISFNTTMHRLRKLLSDSDDVVLISDGHATLNQNYCWTDVWAFESLCGKVENMCKNRIKKDPEETDDYQEAWGLLIKALDLYKGHFFETESDLQWALTTRERLKSKFVDILLNMGIWCEEAAQSENAIECYNKGIWIEPHAEAFYQNLILCRLRLGHYAEALQAYERCRDELSAAFGIEPSEKTKKIIDSLRENRRKHNPAY